MNKVDMSASAVTARLKRVSQLRRLCLSLKKAKLPPEGAAKTTEQRAEASQPAPPKTK
ncbi:MAG: hypothetical protein H7Z16_01115 [Pyrinomonadaceae bacterium]|nr:hypothetical protein [Pyrinomonadaceae bacterium]